MNQKPLAAKDGIDANGDFEVDEGKSRDMFCSFVIGSDRRFGVPMLNVRGECPQNTESPAHMAKINLTTSVKWDFNAFLMYLIAISAGALVASAAVMTIVVSLSSASGPVGVAIWAVIAVILGVIYAIFAKHAEDNPVWLFKYDARNDYNFKAMTGEITSSGQDVHDLIAKLNETIEDLENGYMAIQVPRPIRKCRINEDTYVLCRGPTQGEEKNFGNRLSWRQSDDKSSDEPGIFTRMQTVHKYVLGLKSTLLEKVDETIQNAKISFRGSSAFNDHIDGMQVSMQSKATGELQKEYRNSISTTTYLA